MEFNLTLIIVIATVLTSIAAFRERESFDKLKFNAYMIYHRKEYFRFLSHGFIHVDYFHLAINMYVLYSFGSFVESQFMFFHENMGRFLYAFMYVFSIIVSSVFSFIKHRNNHHYNAVGASGAVSAVVFAFIFMFPTAKLSLLFIPIAAPGYVFGLLYLIYSAVMARRGNSRIGHDAHFWGAVFGILFTIAIYPELFYIFIEQVTN